MMITNFQKNNIITMYLIYKFAIDEIEKHTRVNKEEINLILKPYLDIDFVMDKKI